MAPEPQLSDAEIRVGIAMRELRRGSGMQKVRDRIYGEAVDLAQHDALEVLSAVEHGCRMNELAQALRVDASTATRAVARLEVAGWARREPDPSDGRSVVVALTDEGRARYDLLRERAREALKELFGHFDEAELEQLADLLGRLVAGLDELSETGRGAS